MLNLKFTFGRQIRWNLSKCVVNNWSEFCGSSKTPFWRVAKKTPFSPDFTLFYCFGNGRKIRQKGTIWMYDAYTQNMFNTISQVFFATKKHFLNFTPAWPLNHKSCFNFASHEVWLQIWEHELFEILNERVRAELCCQKEVPSRARKLIEPSSSFIKWF